jgi:hypothetical protein
VRPVLAIPIDERFPELSPDGKWLAYTSDDSGRPELYVQPYPGPGRRVPITSGGAQNPAWSKNGNQLFYSAGTQMMAVPFTVSGGAFVPGKPVPLFSQAPLAGGTTVRAAPPPAPLGTSILCPSEAITRGSRHRSHRCAHGDQSSAILWSAGKKRSPCAACLPHRARCQASRLASTSSSALGRDWWA